MNKEIEMYIYKKVKSETYKNHIQDVIREYYPPPIWLTESINGRIDKAFNDGSLWIQEKINMDFRTRTVLILEETLFTKSTGNNSGAIVNLTPKATFHYGNAGINMDSSSEYGKVANDSIEFLESIKDIYFNDENRKEHELQGGHEKNFNYYWISKKDTIVDPSKWAYLKFTDIYVDTKSVEWQSKYIQGWIKFDFDISKYKELARKKGKDLGNIELPKSACYYARFDFDNNQFVILAAYEILQDNTEKKYVLDKGEIWTYKENPDVVSSVLHKVAEIYNRNSRH